MLRTFRRICTLALIMGFSFSALAVESLTPEQRQAKMRALKWQDGPGSGAIGSNATLAIPAEAALLDGTEGSKFLELTGNLPSPGTHILVSKQWWATFDFSDDGYVSDKDKIDADALLKSLKASDGPSNEQRKQLGLMQIETVGWAVPPHYDPATNYLEWGTKLRLVNSNETTVNYTVRILGRKGYEAATLVTDEASMAQDIADFKTKLKGFSFNSGEKYSEFKQGDKIAAYGLGALVLGGAAAVASKTGFWKVIVGFVAAFWKLLAVGAVAIFAAIGKLFGAKKS